MKYTVKDMQFYASNKGGRCLSENYIGIEAPVDWMCGKGHRFSRSFHYIKAGYWCQKCQRQEFRENRIAEIKKTAEQRGGKCMAEKYSDGNSPLLFCCEAGHKFKISYSNFIKGNWCKQCKIIRHQYQQYQKLKNLVEKKGGKIKSTSFNTLLKPMEFICKKGHVFRLRPLAVNLGVWCDICKKEILYNEIKKRIEAKGGKMISQQYINARDKITVECANGHRRTGDAASIRKEFSCTFCLREKLKQEAFHFIKAWAKAHGGKVLSKTFKNSESLVLFECANGHKFKTTAASMKNQQSWCKTCYLMGMGKSKPFGKIHYQQSSKNGV